MVYLATTTTLAALSNLILINVELNSEMTLIFTGSDLSEIVDF